MQKKVSILRLLIITVIDNTAIAHRFYKDGPLNKSHDIKVSILQAFVITKWEELDSR